MKARSKAIKKLKSKKISALSLKKTKSLIVSIPFNPIETEKEILTSGTEIIFDNCQTKSENKNKHSRSLIVSIDL